MAKDRPQAAFQMVPIIAEECMGSTCTWTLLEEEVLCGHFLHSGLRSALHWIMANDYAVELLQCYMYLEDFSLSRSTKVFHMSRVSMLGVCVRERSGVPVAMEELRRPQRQPHPFPSITSDSDLQQLCLPPNRLLELTTTVKPGGSDARQTKREGYS